ncbi:MAG: hypothetical protein IT441_05620 [Phycisphaeraceae bacterium]|nr:hypothetical protein [Phycisphaeraceae bacterium]
MVICVHEDRRANLTGFKLTILSLIRHSPGLPILASCPGADESTRDWLTRLPRVQLIAEPGLSGKGWSIKPDLLLHCLDRGHQDVTWIDADILATRDIRPLLATLDDRTMLVSEEVYFGQRQGGVHRTLAWGLRPGRALRTTLNTGLLRVTPEHVPLLGTWRGMMQDPAYLQAQRSPHHTRPLHLLSDQEVLTALLGSTLADDIPLHILRRGRDVAQCFGPAGYTPTERLAGLRHGLPTFIHAMGRKPWDRHAPPHDARSPRRLLARLRRRYEHLHAELSPYTCEARRYRDDLSPQEAAWLTPASMIGRVMTATAAGHPTMTEFPLAEFDAVIRHARRALGIGRYRQTHSPDVQLRTAAESSSVERQPAPMMPARESG